METNFDFETHYRHLFPAVWPPIGTRITSHEERLQPRHAVCPKCRQQEMTGTRRVPAGLISRVLCGCGCKSAVVIENTPAPRREKMDYRPDYFPVEPLVNSIGAE